MATINPGTLKTLRERKGLTQQELARLIGCKNDTVSRWERGRNLNVRGHLREALAKALGVRFDTLTEPLNSTSASEPQDSEGRSVRLGNQISLASRNALDLVSQRYKVPTADILELAPLLFTIVAEGSLLERARRLQQTRDDIERATGALMEAIPHYPMHLDAIDAESADPLGNEAASIRSADIYGLQLPVPPAWDSDTDNPFEAHLRRLAEGIPDDVAWFDLDPRIEFAVAVTTLRELTSLGDNDVERLALELIQMGQIDLRECLRVREERNDDDYRAWILDQVIAVDDGEALSEVDLS